VCVCVCVCDWLTDWLTDCLSVCLCNWKNCFSETYEQNSISLCFHTNNIDTQKSSSITYFLFQTPKNMLLGVCGPQFDNHWFVKDCREEMRKLKRVGVFFVCMNNWYDKCSWGAECFPLKKGNSILCKYKWTLLRTNTQGKNWIKNSRTILPTIKPATHADSHPEGSGLFHWG